MSISSFLWFLLICVIVGTIGLLIPSEEPKGKKKETEDVDPNVFYYEDLHGDND